MITLRDIILLSFSFAQAWSPTNGYAPGFVKCPNRNLLRTGDYLSLQESEFQSRRIPIAYAAIEDYISRVGLTDDKFPEGSINYGIAVSGGGFRSMLTAAGALMAMDSRTPGSLEDGHVGGILQGALYTSGLSGGAWLLASLYLNNFTSVYNLQRNSQIWQLQKSILDPILWTSPKSVNQLIGEPLEKHSAGFPISLTDLFGRALSQRFIDNEDKGAGMTWSAMAQWPWFLEATAPLPIIIFNGRTPGETIAKRTAPVFEATPLELGTWDEPIRAFAEMQYIGTKMENGYPIYPDECVMGFDNAGFIFATSSSVFDRAIQIVLDWIPGKLGTDIRDLFYPAINKKRVIVGNYTPNPFYKYIGEGRSRSLADKGKSSDIDDVGFSVPPELDLDIERNDFDASYEDWSNVSASTKDPIYSKQLFLVDGGYNNQKIPVQSLLDTNKRKLHAIIMIDSSGNVDNFPDGSALAESYERQFLVQANWDDVISFPYVPDPQTMLSLNLTRHPVFFGCNGANLTTLGPFIPPLLIYIPNAKYSYSSNKSFLKLRYSNEERDSMIFNGYNLMTYMNSTDDPDWPICLGCGLIQRRSELAGSIYPQCQECLVRYCWDGTLIP